MTFSSTIRKLIQPEAVQPRCRFSDIEDELDLSSFEVQDTLNPKVWDEDDQLNSTIRERLLDISNDFFKDLEVNWLDIEDIILTGSMANYNWSEHSDMDIHIVVDFSKVADDPEFVKQYFDAVRWIWNEKHDIPMYGFDTEVYVQDVNEEHHATGQYSLTKDTWLQKPSREDPDIDVASVEKKATAIIQDMDQLDNLLNQDEYDRVLKGVERLKDKIKKMRQSGLSRAGVFSAENLAFKVLRRQGELDRLADLQTSAYDQSKTIDGGNHDDKE